MTLSGGRADFSREMTFQLFDPSGSVTAAFREREAPARVDVLSGLVAGRASPAAGSRC